MHIKNELMFVCVLFLQLFGKIYHPKLKTHFSRGTPAQFFFQPQFTELIAKIRIFFLQNEIEDALGRILNTINRYLHAKMCEKQCKTRIFALARSFLLDRIRCDHSKFVSERARPDYEKKFAHL